jgi:energy-coupling factor transporter transmembrane protein EcfT
MRWWLQSASLSLTTTPAEEMALGLRLALAPLRLLRVPVDEIALTLLLSLRFMAQVTEEMRNLSLGLAARAVRWHQLPPGGGVQARSLLCPHLCIALVFSDQMSSLPSISTNAGAATALHFLNPPCLRHEFTR